MHIDFTKPYKFEGKEYTGIDLDIEDITGKELKNTVKGYKSLNGNNMLIRNTSTSTLISDDDFIVYFLSQKTKQPIEFFEGLIIPDYLGVIGKVAVFFAQCLV
ncbi:MAG: hypothetical protein II929_05980 [Succinivibrio sp.]|nr:hypothetical protein [Succinivibrio sp.]